MSIDYSAKMAQVRRGSIGNQEPLRANTAFGMQRPFKRNNFNTQKSSIFSIEEATIFDARNKEMNDIFEGNNISDIHGSLG